MRADEKLLAIIPCKLGLFPEYVMDLPLLHFEIDRFISLLSSVYTGENSLYNRQMPEGYKSSLYLS